MAMVTILANVGPVESLVVVGIMILATATCRFRRIRE